jgi:hypothetical protein
MNVSFVATLLAVPILIATSGCVALATSDALVLIEGNLNAEHGQCLASVRKTTYNYADREIKGQFKIDYTAGLSDTWFEVEIRCADGSSFKRRFDRLGNNHLEMGTL